MKPGDIFGSWTVLGRGRIYLKNRLVLVQCVCGVEREVQRGSLLGGKSTSCGCLAGSRRSASLTKHGCSPTKEKSGSPEYNSWRSMRRRCYWERDPGYSIYGARGIRVCPEWDSFEQFLSDMGRRPEWKTLERIDVNGDYSPENCVWATPKEQALNRRTSKYCNIEWRGTAKPLSDWAEEIGLSHSALYRRVVVLEWPIEKAMTTPVRVYQRHG